METEIKFNRLVFALASSNLEDLPAGPGPASGCTNSDHGAKLLDYHQAWTALWSPRIFGQLGFLPESRRTDTSGLDLENALILAPDLSLSQLDQPLEERLRSANNQLLLSQGRSRSDIADEICGQLDPQNPLSSHSLCEQAKELEEDFYAFGYAVMQVQQMARKLRYSFNLDWMIVSDQLVQAAQNFIQANYQEADRWLSAAYDSLSQERDRYCSQQGYLLHLVLTAPSTVSSRFSKELQNDIPTSLFATTQTLQKLKHANPEGFQQLSQRLTQRSMALVGGFSDELKHTYLSELSLHRSFLKAKNDSLKLGLPHPKVLLPFYPSIPAHLPTLARSHGFEGVLLAKFHDGTVPEKEHAKLKWQSTSEGPAIDTVLGHVVDASDPAALLEVGSAMAKQLDYHQVPTLVLAHWPDRACSIFDDLARTLRRTPAIGKWILADEYFESTSQPYWSDQFGPSHFPFAITKQPEQIHSLQISLVHLHRMLHALERLSDSLSLWNLVHRQQEKNQSQEIYRDLVSEIQLLLDQLDDLAKHEGQSLYTPEAWASVFESKIKSVQENANRYIRSCLGNAGRWTILNPASNPRRLSAQVATAIDSDPSQMSDRLVAASRVHQDPSKTQLIVDVPPFGFVSIPQREIAIEKNRPNTTGIFAKLFGQRNAIGQADGSLANEFMEVQVDPKKGHLRSLHVRDQRGNRLSGMVSLVPRPVGLNNRVSEDELIGLSSLSLEQRQISDSEAVVITRGVFKYDPFSDANPPWIEQTIRLRRGIKSLEVSFVGGGFDRQSQTPVWRMIWPSQAASLQMWTHGNRTKWIGPLQANVELIEIDDVEHKVYFATGGLSHHTKQGPNQLQTVLPIGADGNLSATLMIGLDWQRPWETAIDLFQPIWIIPPQEAIDEPSGQIVQKTKKINSQIQSAWLAQSNHPNLRFTVLSAKSDSVGNLHDASSNPGNSPIGQYRDGDETFVPDLLIWITEGAGKSSTAKISLPKNAIAAWKVDLSGQLLDKIQVEGSDMMFPYSAWEKSVLAVVLEN